MKKNIYKYLGLILVTSSILSCSKELDKQPLSNITSPVYSMANLESFLNSTYANMLGEYYCFDNYYADMRTDNAEAGGDNPANFPLDKYQQDATNINVTRDWKDLYNYISNANKVIDRSLQIVSADQATLDRYVGEAKALRAFFYFDLVRLYGSVPLSLHEVSKVDASTYDQIFLKQATVDQVYEQIVKDLNEALPVVATAVDAKKKNGRFTVSKGMVNAMLAYVYATAPVNGANVKRDYAKVVTYCDATIAQGYSLLPTFDWLFDEQHENSNESIFEINVTDPISQENWAPGIMTLNYWGNNWKKFNLPMKNLIDAYDAAGDAVRKASTIEWRTPYFSDNYWPQVDINGVATIKDNAVLPYEHKQRSTGRLQNIILLRLADILLLEAEAKNYLGDQSGAAALVNQVRQRVSLPDISSSLSQADMATAIALERRLELAFECKHWFDLVRNGTAVSYLSAAKYTRVDGGIDQFTLTSDKLLYPIPQSQLDLNSLLKQNPGY